MLVIRLRRTGKKKQPNFRIVVADQRAPIYGKYIEMLGHYDPRTKTLVLNKEKALVWMNQGAKPTNTVGKILKKENLEHKSIIIKKFRAVSKKELETQKVQEEAEKAKVQAEKEAAKAAFEQQLEQEKAAQPSSEEKLQEAASEAIHEIKTEEKEKQEEKPEAPTEEKPEIEKRDETPEEKPKQKAEDEEKVKS